jgi:hypothetical protein
MRTERVTQAVTVPELCALVGRRAPFRNGPATFRAMRLTPYEAERLAASPLLRVLLSEQSSLALAMDEPDYMVWSGKAPLCWHSTTRGIEHRKDESSWEWVMATLSDEGDEELGRYGPRRYNRMARVIDELNRRGRADRTT